MRRWIPSTLITAFLLLGPAACVAGPGPSGAEKTTGTVTGTVSISPLCPMEPCGSGSAFDYSGHNLVLTQPEGVRIEVPLEDDGGFEAAVPAGRYSAYLEDCGDLDCAGAFPLDVEIKAGGNTSLEIDVDTGIRTPAGPQNSFYGLQSLREVLVVAGAKVESGDAMSQPFFTVPGQLLKVNGVDVQVFEYPSAEEAAADAGQVSSEGGSVGQTMVHWVEPPHFFLRQNLLVPYVGGDPVVLGSLEAQLEATISATAPLIFDPSDTLNQSFSLDIEKNPDNWADPRLTELIALQEKEVDTDKRNAMFAEMAAILQKGESQWVPITWHEAGYIHDYRLQGFKMPMTIQMVHKDEALWWDPDAKCPVEGGCR